MPLGEHSCGVYSLTAAKTLMAFKVAMIWVTSRSNATARDAPAVRSAKVLLSFTGQSSFEVDRRSNDRFNAQPKDMR